MENNKYLVTGKFTRTGTGKTGQPYSIEELTVDFNGRIAKIRAPKDVVVSIGDSVILGFGVKRGYGCAELCPVITEVISQEKKGDYNEQN